ncbi:flagellar export protein FliJ [Neobacillus cucumis]|uniref:Flagellar FliJ protein n=1 Tax=Neobacillus cucumis TaxID=1740721 RepID=A0A2N5H7H2_9BACI|nr:flagellar export protein FliJ [Neobacillus cucumis]PLS01463.1 flagellar export protein FliJ [Neobacillus cucumis]
MSFQFRYEKILTMKEKEKDSAFHEMNVFKQMKETAEHQLLELIQKKDHYIRDSQNMMRNSLRVTDIQEREKYIDFLNRQIERVKKKVSELTRELTIKNNVLLTKNQEEKIWSSWREKSLEEYTVKTNREEQNRLDEMAVLRYFYHKN